MDQLHLIQTAPKHICPLRPFAWRKEIACNSIWVVFYGKIKKNMKILTFVMSTPKWLFPLIFKRDVLQVADPAMASFKTSKYFRSFPENPHIFEGPFWDISQHQWHKLAIASAPAAKTAVHSDPGSRHIPRPFSDDSLMPKVILLI